MAAAPTNNSSCLKRSEPLLACVACRSAHQVCNKGRPCARCIMLGKEDQCQAPSPRKRGRPRKLRISTTLREGPSKLAETQQQLPRSDAQGDQSLTVDVEHDSWENIIRSPIADIDAFLADIYVSRSALSLV